MLAYPTHRRDVAFARPVRCRTSPSPKRHALIDFNGANHVEGQGRTGIVFTEGPRLPLLRFGIWIDQRPSFGICGPDDRLHLAFAELIEVVRLHVLKLRPDLTRLRPFAIPPEAEAAAYGVELGLVHVCRELVMIEALCFGHSLRQHLSGRIGERTPGKAERVDSGRARLHAIPLEEIGRARNALRLRRSEVLPDQQAVGEWTELHFERGYQHTDHRAAEHLRRQPDLVGRRMMPTLSGG